MALQQKKEEEEKKQGSKDKKDGKDEIVDKKSVSQTTKVEDMKADEIKDIFKIDD